MKTDKNTLFRAIGDIDEKFVSEVLEEDASGMGQIKSFDAAKAATSAKKKASSGAKKFFMYYLPAVAGLLVCAIIVKSFMTSNSATGGNAAATADSAAPAAVTESVSAGDAMVMEEAEACYDEETDSMNLAGNSEMAAATTTSETYGGKDEDLSMDGMPNPFIDCETLEDACEIADISIEIPDDFHPEFSRIYRAMENKMIEVIFMDGAEEVFRIRKGLVSELGTDISGDYNEYNVSTSVDSADYAATLSGYAEDEYSVAIWNDEMYSYSITFEEPLSLSSATDIIDTIMAK